MLHHPLILAVDVNSNGATAWVVKNIVPLLILAVGVSIMMQFKSGRASKVMSQAGIMFFGLAIIAGAGLWFGFGDTIAKTLFA